MDKQYNPGDRAWIVVSSIMIREVEIIRFSGGLYTVRFTDSKGGIKIRGNRLLASIEEAEAMLPKHKTK